MKKTALTIAFIFGWFELVAACHAASIFLDIPAIPGENPTPGHPAAIAAQSVTITPGSFSVIKHIDSASPKIQLAVANGTPLATSTLLFYDSAASDRPEAIISFQNVLANSSQLLGGNPPSEQDSFSSTTPKLIYLQLPGIVGESSTPGHPDLIQIDSLTLSPNDFTITKLVDKASPPIQSAILKGTPFSFAFFLFYDSTIPLSFPDSVLIFQNVLGSSFQLQGNNPPLEQDTFNFQSITQIPEPQSSAILLISVALLIVPGRRRFGQLRPRFMLRPCLTLAYSVILNTAGDSKCSRAWRVFLEAVGEYAPPYGTR
jgi:type VI protein secretion system component Hcp